MFEKFYDFFGVHDVSIKNKNSESKKVFTDFLDTFGGQSFKKGLYRLHTLNSIDIWNSNIIQAFPEYKGRIKCFGYDWLGRQFALDYKRVVKGQPQILMFEPGTGEVLEIPCDIVQFHDEEIPMYHDACLASGFFKEWTLSNPAELTLNECIGYKRMLFLGGEDTIQNLEKSNMDVYWYICGQLILKIRDLPEGSPIKGIRFSK